MSRNTAILANKRILWNTALMTLAKVQYGFDAAVIESFQAMEGFLKIFGYALPPPRHGYEIVTTTQHLIM